MRKVSIDGVGDVFIKTATVRERGLIMRAGGVKPSSDGAEIADIAAFQAKAIVLLVCTEGGTPIFSETDVEALQGLQVDSPFNLLAEEAAKGLNPGAEAKN